MTWLITLLCKISPSDLRMISYPSLSYYPMRAKITLNHMWRLPTLHLGWRNTWCILCHSCEDLVKMLCHQIAENNLIHGWFFLHINFTRNKLSFKEKERVQKQRTTCLPAHKTWLEIFMKFKTLPKNKFKTVQTLRHYSFPTY